ncbi:MAG: hypothetical protein IPI39_20860 [Candidatus Obscuribacter sp.]|nr:hypothetical protein [Candidatus Obscuribacter sp.]
MDIPLGDVRTAKNDLEHSDYTQWVVVKDLTNRVLYFRSYYNQALCQIDLKKLDFGSGTESRRLMAVSGGISSLDMTDLLPGAKGEPSK